MKLTQEVGHVAKEPDDEKGHAQPVGVLGLEVGDELGQLQRNGRVSGARRGRLGEQRAETMAHTMTHIQATRLMLPKMPEMASEAEGECDSAVAAMTAWATNEAMGVGVVCP